MADEITYHADPNVIKYISDKVHNDFYYLGLGKEIPSGADLNDYKTPGVYSSTGSRGIEEMVNSPQATFDTEHLGGPAFTLIVTALKHSNGMIGAEQRLMCWNGKEFYRSTGSEGFKGKPWILIGGIDSILAEGTTNGWAWIKYANGFAIASKGQAINIPAASLVAVYSNHWRTVFTWPLPFTFITTKEGSITVSGFCGSDTSMTDVQGANKDGNNIYVIPVFNSKDDKVVSINVLAMGWWK